MVVATRRPAEIWPERRRRVAELRARQGFVRQLLDFYGALLAVQEAASVEASDASPAPARIGAYVAEAVVPRVVDVSVAMGPERLRADLIERLTTASPQEMIAAWMRGDDQTLIDRFLARASLEPVLEALGSRAASECGGPRGGLNCPECGGPPQLSYHAPAGEDLATGPRRLLCARCGASWGYPRMTCASCGEDSSAKLPIFSEEGTASGERGSVVRGLPGGASAMHGVVFPHVRIEACETCRRYLLNIDLAADPKAVPLVDELAAVPLDLYARDRGFSKITPNLMGF